MTAQPDASVFRPAEDRGDFCALRSQLVDEFVRLELAVSRCLAGLRIEIDPRKTSFRQQVAALSKAKPCPSLSKDKAAGLATLPQDCERLQRLRASLVHGVMEPCLRNGELAASFRNVADVIGGELVYHVLTTADFRDSIASVRKMTQRVEASLNRPVGAGCK
jgi:hypothetical protein